LINGATGVFAAQIVASFGYGPLETVLLGMPTGMFMTASALLVAIPNMWLKNMRIKICAASAIVPLIAALLVKREYLHQLPHPCCLPAHATLTKLDVNTETSA
jgi:hypothetical protein